MTAKSFLLFCIHKRNRNRCPSGQDSLGKDDEISEKNSFVNTQCHDDLFFAANDSWCRDGGKLELCCI